MFMPKTKFEKLKNEMCDDGMYYCSHCDNYFIVRNSCDGDINTNVCPCCGIFSQDGIEPVDHD